MKKRAGFALLFFSLILLKMDLLATGCGSTNIQLDPTTTTGSTCDDTGETVVTDYFTVEITGDACNAPSPSKTDTGDINLDCTQPEARDTSNSREDYATATCSDGTVSTSKIYYCVDGILYRDNGEDVATELYDITTLTCITDDSEATITEGELIVS